MEKNKEKILIDFIDNLLIISRDIGFNIKNGLYDLAISEIIKCDRNIKEIVRIAKESGFDTDCQEIKQKLRKLQKNLEKNSILISSNLKFLNDVLNGVSGKESEEYVFVGEKKNLSGGKF
ncbi:MAG: hypothetical protein AB1602_05345 [Elusimicrobiota bacterium]